MKGQLELFPKKKRLIYSRSLTWYRTICPYCKVDNPDREKHDTCYSCGGVFDNVNLDIRTSKDLAECEALGLKGAVRKDEKGKWVQA